MSNQVSIHAEPRPRPSKGDSGRLRRAGRIPGILYGHGVTPAALSVDARELDRALRTSAGANVLLRVDLDDATHLAVARDVQRDPVRGDILHVDLLAVDRDARIHVDVPVRLVDVDDVARDGGVMNHALHSVAILVSPLDTPDVLEVSVAGMGIGDLRRVRDLASSLPAGAELLGDLEDAVVVIASPGGSSSTEAGAAPEAAEA